MTGLNTEAIQRICRECGGDAEKIAAELARVEAVRDELKRIDHRTRQTWGKHRDEMAVLNAERQKVQQQCKHWSVRSERAAWGGDKCARTCNVCGVEV